jgi:hypothetical protein
MAHMLKTKKKVERDSPDCEVVHVSHVCAISNGSQPGQDRNDRVTEGRQCDEGSVTN